MIEKTSFGLISLSISGVSIEAIPQLIPYANLAMTMTSKFSIIESDEPMMNPMSTSYSDFLLGRRGSISKLMRQPAKAPIISDETRIPSLRPR
jgi:hypothetical protein